MYIHCARLRAGSLLVVLTLAGAALAASAWADDVAPAPARSAPRVPAALQSVLYAALARDAGASYRLDSRGCVSLPKSALRACFDRSGAHFNGVPSPLALHLVAWGRAAAEANAGSRLATVPPVKPLVRGNRVRYAHGNMCEWWRVLPIGFEQGFTIARRPSGTGELTLLLAANAPGAAASRRNGLGWGKLRYGRLVVTDFSGRVIPATLASNGNRIRIAVNDTDAVYPLTVDPLVWLRQTFSAADGAPLDEFGVAIAHDGDTVVVGAPNANINGNRGQGGAYVFMDSGGIWTQTQKLVAEDGAAQDSFGSSVAIDGSTILVGAPYATVNGNAEQGAAYVFVKSGGTWSEVQKLVAEGATIGDHFGWSVALSGDSAFVGAPATTVDGYPWEGTVYVFGDSAGAWSPTQTLFASDGAVYSYFGWSLAADGPMVLVGAGCLPFPPGLDWCGRGKGYVFMPTDGGWMQTAELDGGGISVALSGNTAIVGAVPYWEGPDYTIPGTASIYSETSGVWSLSATFQGADMGYDWFGAPVAVFGDAALVGASSDGVLHRYKDRNGTWSPGGTLPIQGGGSLAAAVFSSGALFVGPIGGAAAGNAVYYFGESNLDLTVSAPQTVNAGETYVSQTIATNNASTASPAVSTTITVPAGASFVSATASQGHCHENSGMVRCRFGTIEGNAGTASANVTLKATGDPGATIENSASVERATPPLTAGAATRIIAGGACPQGYGEYDGSLAPGKFARSPSYRAPAGQEDAILTGPAGFRLFAAFQNAEGRKIYRIPGNEIHHSAPAGTYAWIVKAGDGAGSYTLCLLHP